MEFTEEKINRLLNSITKGCDGNIADEVKAIIIKQQKEIKKEKSRIMELAELLDKQENEIKFLKGELEIQEGCSISKDKIREKINELETLYNCNLDTVLTSYEMFHFVRSYVDKVKNILEELLEENNEKSNTL